MVNTAPPQLPELPLHKFSLRTSGQQQSRDAALGAFILWMFQDHLVNYPNQTGYEIVCSSGILAERHL